MHILLMLLLSCSVSAYQFDRNSCKTSLPTFNNTRDTFSTGLLKSQDISGDSLNLAEASASDETSEEDDDEYDGVLLPALERSPYRVTASSLNYRRNRVLSVTIEGPGFTGLLIHAVRRFPSSFSSRPSVIGNFVDLPSDFDTMDCNRRLSIDNIDNTAFTTSLEERKNLVLKWKAPSEDFDSIEFKATIIRGKYYWTHNKSPPLFFNHFPPSTAECGKAISCLQYSESARGCEDGLCDYIVISEVHQTYVNFHIGGRISGDTGYVGIGFTTDREKLSFLDVYVCVKLEHRAIDAVHYIYNKSLVNLERSVTLESVVHDHDGEYIWCKFRRPLQYPKSTSAVDLSKLAYQAVLWGTIDFVDNHPILQDETTIEKGLKLWNLTRTLNIIQRSNGPILTSHTWIVFLAVIMTKFLELNY